MTNKIKRVLKVISLAAVLTAAILFCGCDALLGGAGFYSCHYKEDGSKTEYFSDADETLYHYPLKDIEYGPDGNIVKISEYENFFTDSGRFADSCDKKISVYENGELKTVTEYKNEFLGEGYVVSVKEKVTHYKNGEIVNVETFQ